MLFYFIAAVHTSAIKYSTITVQRKYVGGEMLTMPKVPLNANQPTNQPSVLY